ncbi:hypothetical protein [Nocardia pseudobrasiliensis]|uniref:Uncharacterized protein n=1 Tax=Nocardia pseudobrasiliensis TaxID=45979 RepID=A0A370I7M3_9NOCA|nr:hypothetical protein [Nocardia pseudobrasiliensis]RDI65344.1 hypothetical protein DFR76_106214 [Nocardia pseudobrasiliensis]
MPAANNPSPVPPEQSQLSRRERRRKTTQTETSLTDTKFSAHNRTTVPARKHVNYRRG